MDTTNSNNSSDIIENSVEIPINDTDNRVVLNVPNEPDEALIEEPSIEAPSVFPTRKKILLGGALLVLLIVPLVAGTYLSFMYRQMLYNPVDPDNLWPETEYTGAFIARIYEDPGFSDAPNNLIHIKNGQEDVFETNTPKTYTDQNSKNYVSVSVVENLYGKNTEYALNFIVNTENKDMRLDYSIRKAKDIKGLLDEDNPYMVHFKNFESYVLNYEYESIKMANQIAESLKQIPSSNLPNDQSETLQIISENVQKQMVNCEEHITKRAVIFSIPNEDVSIPILDHLTRLRRKEAEKYSAAPSKSKPKSPQFTRIKIRGFNELLRGSNTTELPNPPHSK
jgi:hypothetical protein